MSKSIHLLWVLWVAVVICVSPSVSTRAVAESIPQTAEPTYSLQSARQPDSIDRVAVTLEVRGVLKSPRETKIEQSKLNVKAKLAYEERALGTSEQQAGPRRSARYYDEAEATVQAGEKEFAPRLRPEHRLVAAEINDAKVTLFSPQGPLTWDELDLIDLPADSLLVDRFLPDRPVAQGDTWAQADDLVTAALGLDRVRTNTITSTLAKVDAKSAIVEFAGRVEGAASGVTTRIEVKGKYRFNRQTRRIDWLGLLVREDRDVGHVGPGLDVVARLEMQIAPRESSERLSDKALADLPLKPSEALTQLVYESERDGWRFQHDRRWFVTGGDHELAFLRLIDRGDFVAQCNVAVLAPVEPGKQATLEQFQQDIQKALGDEFGEFVSAGQKANKQNYRVLRVIARGTVSSLPIEWRYYLVADEHGRQVTFAFSVEQPLVERLGELDRQMVASLRFDPPKVAMKDKTSP